MARKWKLRAARPVEEEPRRAGSKARLYGYGFRAIATAAGCSLRTVQAAFADGTLEPGSLRAVLAWIVKRRTPAERLEVCTPAPNAAALIDYAATDATPTAPPAPRLPRSHAARHRLAVP